MRRMRMTRYYQCSGRLDIEGSTESAEYDFVLEWEDFREPQPMDILNDMLNTGLIQIISEECEEVDG
jgi:hypothetical protein